MGRTQGTFDFSANLELKIEGVVDARQLVDNFSDLLDFDSNNFIPLGFPVAVKGVQDSSERGVYQCIDNTDLSNPNSWEKIGEEAIETKNRPKQIIVNSDLSTVIPLPTFCRASLNVIDPPITLESGDIPFFNIVYKEELVVFTLNNIFADRSFGLGEPDIQTSQIQIVSRRPLNVGSIDDTSTEYIDIIATVSDTDNVWERVNLDEYNVQPLSEGFTVFRAEVDGEVLNWLYKGESGVVGVNGYQTLEDDFQLLNPSESGTPTLQQVVDASGNVVYAEFPTGTYIKDSNGTFVIQLGDSFFRFDSNGSLELDAQRLVIKDSNASLVGRALVVQADGGVDWENISVDLSDYYTKEEIDEIINSLPEGYTSQDFNNDFSNKTTDDLSEGLTNKYNANHTGDVTGSTNLTITNQAVTNAKLANMNANTIKGRETTNGAPQDLTPAEVRSIINVENGAQVNQQPITQPPQLVNGVVQVDLSNPQGIFSESTVTTTEQFEVILGAVTGGVHVFRVNLPTDPDASITGATRYLNSEFIENVDLLLIFEQFNFGTRYYFLEI